MLRRRGIRCPFGASHLLFLAPLLLGGCVRRPLRYSLNDKEIVRSTAPAPLKVQVATFSDRRDAAEREKAARESKGDADIGDYTYDKEFRGSVAEEITKMLVSHLNYSKAFSTPVTLTSFPGVILTGVILDSLAKTGVDAVLTGDVDHFYGYYDRNFGRELLYELPLAVASGLLLNFSFSSGSTQYTFFWYGPGLVLGIYLESLHQRQIGQHVQLNAKLISTKSHQPLWENSFDVALAGKRSMHGLSGVGRKYEVALSSLRNAVNLLVESLAKGSLSTGKP